jgi:hypothetical protein
MNKIETLVYNSLVATPIYVYDNYSGIIIKTSRWELTKSRANGSKDLGSMNVWLCLKDIADVKNLQWTDETVLDILKHTCEKLGSLGLLMESADWKRQSFEVITNLEEVRNEKIEETPETYGKFKNVERGPFADYNKRKEEDKDGGEEGKDSNRPSDDK